MGTNEDKAGSIILTSLRSYNMEEWRTPLTEQAQQIVTRLVSAGLITDDRGDYDDAYSEGYSEGYQNRQYSMYE